jgi:hypothetical protein
MQENHMPKCQNKGSKPSKKRRGMELDTRCVVCGRLNEDGGHLFFKCEHVKLVWQDLNLEMTRGILSHKQSAREVLQHVLGMKENVQVKVVILLWQWWLERNRIWKGERQRPPSVLAAAASKITDENLAIGKTDHSPATQRQKRWSRPADDSFKINSDGSYSPESGDGGWGYVIRDHDGTVIKAGAGRCSYLLDAFHSEVVGCKAGIRAAEELGMSKVVIETDSLLLKMALESNSFALAQTGGILCEIKTMLLDSFSSWSFSLCPRECNKVVHAVTAQGCMCPHETVLCWNGTPPGVEDLVARDCSSSLS